jgi:hypothetical protein
MAVLRSVLALILVALASAAPAQPRVTTPREEFGFNFGDDYQLATYSQLAAYWHKLDAESDRVVVQEIGKTSEGRPHLMAIVTSPENHRQLERFKQISRRLATVDGLTDEDARALAREGRAVVWIDGGLHASEVLGAQQLGEMVYQMASGSDEETMRLLNDTIILFVHANPDGHELVAGWYMRNPTPERRTSAGLPRLYHPYIGHDNNRDFFASTQKETENINRVLYHEWFPQLLYNHHQSGPAGTVFWSPPFRDPFNYNQDPLLVLGLQQLGLAIHARLAAEGKPGASMRSSGPYDGWWNGGIRNTATFHNIIAILTEMIGSPTPMRIPFVMQRQIPTSDLPYPIAPQTWHFRQSVDYSVSNNKAVLDFGSKWRETLLFNIYRMGRNSVERGSRDEWTPAPHRYAAVAERMAAASGGANATSAERDRALWAEIRNPASRDPRGFIIPANQPDFPTATKFVNALREVGIVVHRGTRDFEVQGKTYPRGSFVVFTAQPFRPHVMDMFEPQDHPDNFPSPGAPPIPPYDNAGWTLAFQMGIEFERVLDAFTGPFELVTDWNVPPPAATVTELRRPAGYLLSHQVLDSFTAVNRLLTANEEAYWLQQPLVANGRTHPAGTWYIKARPSTAAALRTMAADLGVGAEATLESLPPTARRLRAPRIGLWDQYGGSMDSGWARWVLEQFRFPFERVFPGALDRGGLNATYDVLVFVDGGIPAPGRPVPTTQPAAEDIPAEFRPTLGYVTDRTMPRIREFIEAGGTVIAIGDSSINLARHLKLPIDNHLTEGGQPLTNAKFYAPGSVLSAAVDVAHPLAHGMKAHTDVFFDNSPVFRLAAAADTQRIKPVAWFDSPAPLRSGWAWGQRYLEKGIIAVDVPLGKGTAILYGPEILKRAQPHGTFKLLFNGLYRSALAPVPAAAPRPATGSGR